MDNSRGTEGSFNIFLDHAYLLLLNFLSFGLLIVSHAILVIEYVKLARERVEKSSTLGTEKEPVPLELPSVSTLEAPSTTADTSTTAKELASNALSVAAADLQTDKDASPGTVSSVETNGGVQSPVNIVPSSCAISENDNTAGVVEVTTVEPRYWQFLSEQSLFLYVG